MTLQRTLLWPVAALMLSSSFAMAADVKLRLAGTLPAEHFGSKVLEQMIEEIESANVGVTVQYFPAGQLGSGEELFNDVRFGNIDMVHGTVYAQADPRLEVLSLPFLISSGDEIRSVLGDPTSEFNTVISEILADHGVQHLATIGEGLIGMIATDMPADPRGLGPKDMNIRVWSSQIVKTTMETLGYQTTTMNWAEVFPAVQAGTIDGAICCTPEWAYTTFAASDVGNTFLAYNAFVEIQEIYISGQSWDKLSPEQQEVIQTAASKAASTIAEDALERSEGFVGQLRDKGWTIVEFTPEEMSAIREKVVADVWPTLSGSVGQDLIDRLTK